MAPHYPEICLRIAEVRRGRLSLLLYGVTTLSFGAESKDELRKVG